MPETIDFERIAFRLAAAIEEQTQTAAAIDADLIARQLRLVWNARGVDACLLLTPWLQHHSACGRLGSAGFCDCGLTDALNELND